MVNLPSLTLGTDVLGLSQPATALINGLGAGISATASFFTEGIRDRRQLERLRNTAGLLREFGLDVDSGTLNLSERANLQATISNVKAQANREAIAIEAVLEHEQADNPGDVGTIDPEWMDRFWQLADTISTEGRQQLWGRILSRKASGIGSISVRTLLFLHSLSAEEAATIQRIASVACTTTAPDGSVNCGLLSLVRSAQGTFPLSKAMKLALPNLNMQLYGPIGFFMEGVLHQLWYYKDQPNILGIGNQSFTLTLDHELASSTTYFTTENPKGPPRTMLSEGVVVSTLGREVVALIDEPPSADYLHTLKTQLAEIGFVLRATRKTKARSKA